MLGILLIDKPLGITSHDVVDNLRRRLGTKRVGHAGTLDPLATGLLVVAVGPATRFLQYLPLEPKEYVAQIQFGAATASYDAEGEVTASGDVPIELEAAIGTVLPRFLGLIEQLPPMFSAVKVGGRPLYSYARRGAEVERRRRTVHVEAFDVLSIDGSCMTARVVCSGGTYIRSLAHDLGAEVGCGAHLRGLRRTRVGRFSIEQATDLDSVSENTIPLQEALFPMPIQSLDESTAKAAREGRAVPRGPEITAGVRYAMLSDQTGELIGVARVDTERLRPECILPQEVKSHV